MQSAAKVAGRAITSAQFKLALRNVFDDQSIARLPRLGLAVSGGVDSMALLFLWKEYAKSHGLSLDTSCKVFLVDHKARPNSTVEASQVAEHVKKLIGLDAQILTLDWPAKGGQSVSNFESLARKLRYQALGRACRDNDISKIMLAHHEDDSMETVLHRISTDHYGDALSGISPVAQLPECEGQHGIYESGAPVPLAHPNKAQPWCYESGGVSLLRPLLSFSKEDLIDTCKANGVTWFEDPTNQDPTFTKRNAIRSIFKSDGLPQALSTGRLRLVMTKAFSERYNVQKQRDMYLSRCAVQLFDLRSGTLNVTLPPLSSVFPAGESTNSVAEKYYLCCSIISYFIDLVAPSERVRLSQLGPIVVSMFGSEFPELNAFMRSESAYMTDGTYIRPLRIPNELKRLGRRKGSSALQRSITWSVRQLTQARDRRHSLWQFSRAVPHATKGMQAFLFTSTKSNDQTVHSQTLEALAETAPYSDVSQVKQNSFALWDGRYWIRLTSCDINHDLVLTSPTEESLKELSRVYYVAGDKHDKSRYQLTSLLHDLYQINNLQAIPAVVAPPGVPGVQLGLVLALPTYGLVHPDYQGRITWDVRYKRMDYEVLGLVPEHMRPFILRSRT